MNESKLVQTLVAIGAVAKGKVKYLALGLASLLAASQIWFPDLISTYLPLQENHHEGEHPQERGSTGGDRLESTLPGGQQTVPADPYLLDDIRMDTFA